MNAIQIPGKSITLEQAAHLLAEAVTPGDPDAVRWSLNELLAAAQSGALRGRNPKTLAPVDAVGIPPADYANWMILTGDDLRQLAAERNIQVEGGDVARMTAATHTAPAAHVELVQAALDGKRWTDERLAGLAAYRAEHGTKKAAKHFGISESRVRFLLPSAKNPTVIPFSGLGSRQR